MKPKSLYYLFCFISKNLFFVFFIFSSTQLTSQSLKNKSPETDKKETSTPNWSKHPFVCNANIEHNGQFSAYLNPTENNFKYCIDNGTSALFNNNEVLFCFSESLLSQE